MKQRGFTLIELVVVIVILGILAATALPRYIDLKSDAENAAVAGVAGGLTSATALNYGAYQISTGKALGVTTCPTALATMVGGGVTGYTITPGAACAGGPPKTGTCTVAKTGGTASISAVATIVCTN